MKALVKLILIILFFLFLSPYFSKPVEAVNGTLKLQLFDDINRNGNKDPGEQGVAKWYRVWIYAGSDCESIKGRIGSITDNNGQYQTQLLEPGNFSAKPYLNIGWVNTTPPCQAFEMKAGEITSVSVGITRERSLSYFSQRDPVWGEQEYDHGNTYGPFFCGTTIAGCGCAITSAAMLLHYHGAYRSPTGEDTNPATLNTWLRNNNGYAFGAIKWNSVATYSAKANQLFGTQRIKFAGMGNGANDIATVFNDIMDANPVILEETNHFVITAPYDWVNFKYAIHDPYWQDRQTLNDAYNREFLSMRRYEKGSNLSALYIQAPAPTEVLVTNSQGKRVGKDMGSGTVFNEIPNSYYFKENPLADNSIETPPSPPPNSEVNTLIILEPDADKYKVEATNSASPIKIEFSGYDQAGDISTHNVDNQTTTEDGQEFNLDYSPTPGSEINVEESVRQVQIDYLPFYSPNLLPLKKARLPIAILGAEDFDVKNILLSSIIIAKDGAPLKNKRFFWDVNRDKIKDLVFFFDPIASGVGGQDTSLCLTGLTKDDIKFKGCDSISVITRKHHKNQGN